jgi:hypothetical protein
MMRPPVRAALLCERDPLCTHETNLLSSPRFTFFSFICCHLLFFMAELMLLLRSALCHGPWDETFGCFCRDVSARAATEAVSITARTSRMGKSNEATGEQAGTTTMPMIVLVIDGRANVGLKSHLLPRTTVGADQRQGTATRHPEHGLSFFRLVVSWPGHPPASSQPSPYSRQAVNRAVPIPSTDASPVSMTYRQDTAPHPERFADSAAWQLGKFQPSWIQEVGVCPARQSSSSR